MLPYLQTLQHLVEPGVQLQKNELIKRYRSLKNHNKAFLRMICMTQFFMIRKNERGEVSFA